jgi:pimeloyl-ACP methyl ester carboxylesterase
MLSGAVLIAALAAVRPAAAEAAPGFRACPKGKGTLGAQCATVGVPLDRSGVIPGTIGLHVERVRLGGFRSAPPLIALAGGPGQGASYFTFSFAAELAPALGSRDLVVFDQRGTGLSGALRCWPFASVDIRTQREMHEAVNACGASIGPRAAHYTTADSVEDIEAVREALGVERIALFGVSYGTKVALAYAARYPGRVDRLILDSVLRPEGPDVFWRSSFAAVPRVLRSVCGRSCAFTKDPAADLAALTGKLAGGPVTGYVVRGDGRRHPARLGRVDLFGLLLSGDFDSALRGALPAAVANAAAGDLAPLLRLREDARYIESEIMSPRVFSSALYVATVCGDSVMPWTADATPEERMRAAREQVESVPAADFAPFDATTALAAGQLGLCRSWPHSGRATADDAALPDVPALLLAGTHDLRTPVADARAVAAELPRARLLVVGGVGHSVLTSGPRCVSRAVLQFLAGRRSGSCAGVPGPAPDRPAPASLADVGPAGTPRPARLLEAARLTVEDAVRRLPTAYASTATWAPGGFAVRAGGLRSGRFTAYAKKLVLERVVYVPGVTVDGEIEGSVHPTFATIRRAHGTLHVRGPGVSGTLTLRNEVLFGTVGGARVAMPLSLR